MSTAEQRQQWQAIADRAMPGECRARDFGGVGASIAIQDANGEWGNIGNMAYHDAELYVAAREAMPVLLAEVAALESQIADAERRGMLRVAEMLRNDKSHVSDDQIYALMDMAQRIEQQAKKEQS